jgi:hypothetical protein
MASPALGTDGGRDVAPSHFSFGSRGDGPEGAHGQDGIHALARAPAHDTAQGGSHEVSPSPASGDAVALPGDLAARLDAHVSALKFAFMEEYGATCMRLQQAHRAALERVQDTHTQEVAAKEVCVHHRVT